MHSLGAAYDGVDGARSDAQRAADANGLIDMCDGRRTIRAARGVQRLNRPSGEGGQRDNGLRAAGRTTVDVRCSRRNRFSIGTTSVISATCALRLRQQRVDTVGEGFLGIHG